MSSGDQVDSPSDQTCDPRIQIAFETAIATARLPDIIKRLSAFLAHRTVEDDTAQQIHDLIYEAFDQVLSGRHNALFDPKMDLFRFLARVLLRIAAQFEHESDAANVQIRRR